jgi:hypothetical protein
MSKAHVIFNVRYILYDRQVITHFDLVEVCSNLMLLSITTTDKIQNVT